MARAHSARDGGGGGDDAQPTTTKTPTTTTTTAARRQQQRQRRHAENHSSDDDDDNDDDENNGMTLLSHISRPGPDILREMNVDDDDDDLPSLELSPLWESESPVEYSSPSGRPRLMRYRRICASRLASVTCTCRSGEEWWWRVW
jgi:hypothetical protein